ncbi:hypothetical protein N8482_01015 [Chitinophagales bacterium]|nr:hypothetical protein [Chitinophagales bacterium]
MIRFTFNSLKLLPMFELGRNPLSAVLAALLVFAAFSLSSCEKESVDSLFGTESAAALASTGLLALSTDDDTDEDGSPDREQGMCFEFSYPITVVFPEGNSEEVGSKDDLFTALENWRALQDERPEEKPTLEFPVDITLEDGTTENLEDDSDLKEVLKDCFEGRKGRHGHGGGHGRKGPCFEPVFPVTVVFADGTTATVNDLEELKDAVKDYYTENDLDRPDDGFDLSFEYPIEIIYEDGESATINSDEDLEVALESCYDGEGCEGEWGESGESGESGDSEDGAEGEFGESSEDGDDEETLDEDEDDEEGDDGETGEDEDGNG